MVQGQQAPPGKTWTMKTFLLMRGGQQVGQWALGPGCVVPLGQGQPL